MAGYNRDRARVDAAMRRSGVCVVMNKNHVAKPEHLVTTMRAVSEAGYVAECTFRIDEGIIREAMRELTRIRDGMDHPFVLGVGSVINPKELESAIDMGFDMIVAPANVMGGYGEGAEFIRIAHKAGIFCAPAVLTPTELNYFIERKDGLEPDAIKIFPAGALGPRGFSDLLAPFVRDRHKGRMIMPTGGVDFVTGPQYIKSISERGFFPVLGMSAPLKLVETEKKPGDPETIARSLSEFASKLAAAKAEQGPR